MEKHMIENTLSLALSYDKRHPVEQVTVRLPARYCRAVQHPTSGVSHRLDRSAQPGVTMRHLLPSTGRSTPDRREFFFSWNFSEPWSKKKSWSLPICSLGKDLNLTYRQKSHWEGTKRVTKSRAGRSQLLLKSPGFRLLFPWRWWTKIHPTPPAVRRIPKGIRLESFISKNSSVPG